MVFGWSVGAAFIFGFLYAVFIHWVSKKGLVGQTAWSVVVGVTFTLLVMIPFFGLDAVSLMFAYFAATGIPMVIEYIARVQSEIQQDKKSANDIAKDLLK